MAVRGRRQLQLVGDRSLEPSSDRSRADSNAAASQARADHTEEEHTHLTADVPCHRIASLTIEPSHKRRHFSDRCCSKHDVNQAAAAETSLGIGDLYDVTWSCRSHWFPGQERSPALSSQNGFVGIQSSIFAWIQRIHSIHTDANVRLQYFIDIDLLIPRTLILFLRCRLLSLTLQRLSRSQIALASLVVVIPCRLARGQKMRVQHTQDV
jgi:hypothetical protein